VQATFAPWREVASRTCVPGARLPSALPQSRVQAALGRFRRLISRKLPCPRTQQAAFRAEESKDRFFCLFIMFLVLASTPPPRTWLLDSILFEKKKVDSIFYPWILHNLKFDFRLCHSFILDSSAHSAGILATCRPPLGICNLTSQCREQVTQIAVAQAQTQHPALLESLRQAFPGWGQNVLHCTGTCRVPGPRIMSEPGSTVGLENIVFKSFISSSQLTHASTYPAGIH
jgi:hypothetical protein